MFLVLTFSLLILYFFISFILKLILICLSVLSGSFQQCPSFLCLNIFPFLVFISQRVIFHQVQLTPEQRSLKKLWLGCTLVYFVLSSPFHFLFFFCYVYFHCLYFTPKCNVGIRSLNMFGTETHARTHTHIHQSLTPTYALELCSFL